MEYKPGHDEEDERASGASGKRHRACCLGWGRGREESETYRQSQYWRLQTSRENEGRTSMSNAVALGRACPVGPNAQAGLGPGAAMVVAMAVRYCNQVGYGN